MTTGDRRDLTSSEVIRGDRGTIEIHVSKNGELGGPGKYFYGSIPIRERY